MRKNKKSYKKPLFILCRVSQGMFSNEWEVTVELSNGYYVIAFIDKKQVFIKQEPEKGQKVGGKVMVSVVTLKKDTIIVDLPQPTLTKGTRIEISKQLVVKDDFDMIAEHIIETHKDTIKELNSL